MIDSRSTPASDSRPLLQRKTVWVLIVIIALMAEYQLIYWTSDFGSDPDVVGHVGFAGTIVSTVLALVAIGYAYYQTFSQRRDAEAIAAQIGGMQSLLRTLDASGEQIREQTAALKAVQVQLAHVGSHQERVTTAVESMKIALDSRSAVAVAEAAATDSDDETLRAVVDKFVKGEPDEELIFFAAACEVARRKGSNHDFRKLVSMAATYHLNGIMNAANTKTLAEWYEGMATGYFWALSDQDCIVFSGGDSYEVHGYFRESVMAALARMRSKPAVEKVKGKYLPLGVAAYDAAVRDFWPEAPKSEATPK
jgi:hypothetical protein